MGRQVFRHSQKSRAPARVAVTGEDKCHYSKCSLLSSFFPQLYMLSMMSCGMEYPLGQLGSAVLVSPPSLLTGGMVCGAEKALTLCKHCSAKSKTSTLFSAQIQNIASYQLLGIKLTQSKPAQFYIQEYHKRADKTPYVYCLHICDLSAVLLHMLL